MLKPGGDADDDDPAAPLANAATSLGEFLDRFRIVRQSIRRLLRVEPLRLAQPEQRVGPMGPQRGQGALQIVHHVGSIHWRTGLPRRTSQAHPARAGGEEPC